MHGLWQAAGWLARKAVTLVLLMIGVALVLMLPVAAVPVRREGNFDFIIGRRMEWDRYWEAVGGFMRRLVRGELIPAPAEGENVALTLDGLPNIFQSQLSVTLWLLFGGLVASLALGMLGGILISRYAPGWVRRLSWSGTTLLLAVPDLIMVTALQLLFLFGGRRIGVEVPVVGEPMPMMLSWSHLVLPWAALVLLALPYVARVTATAIDETASQLYVRAAVARGLGPARVLFKHVGKNVLGRLWAALPAVAGVLVSALAVVEFMTTMPGLAREAVQAGLPQNWAGYVSVSYLVPLLVAFVLVDAVADAGSRLLDPRLRGEEAAAAPRRERRGGGGVSAWLGGLWRLPVDLARGLGGLWPGLQAAAAALPGALGRALRALRDPVLLLGTLTVAFLLAVAVLAPALAPFGPAEENMAYIDEAGKIQAPPFRPGEKFILGTDLLGRDNFSRIVFATRFGLLFAALAVPARLLLAAVLGMMAAWRGGFWDRVIRWLSMFFTAIPSILFPLVLIPVVNDLWRDRPELTVAWGVFLVALPGFPRLAESVRQHAREIMAQPFMEAPLAAGAGAGRTLFRHILPHLGPYLATLLALEVPVVLTQTAVLGLFQAFPGGVIVNQENNSIIGPLMPEWGSMMEHPFRLLRAGNWWDWTPLIALSFAILSFNLLGEGLRRRWATRTGWQ